VVSKHLSWPFKGMGGGKVLLMLRLLCLFLLIRRRLSLTPQVGVW
jgi:hypothetical protein